MQDAAPEGDLALALRALVDALAQLVVGEVRGVVGIVVGGQRIVAGLHGQLLRQLRQQLLGDDRRIDVDRALALLEAARVLAAQQVDAPVQLDGAAARRRARPPSSPRSEP